MPATRAVFRSVVIGSPLVVAAVCLGIAMSVSYLVLMKCLLRSRVSAVGWSGRREERGEEQRPRQAGVRGPSRAGRTARPSRQPVGDDGRGAASGPAAGSAARRVGLLLVVPAVPTRCSRPPRGG